MNVKILSTTLTITGLAGNLECVFTSKEKSQNDLFLEVLIPYAEPKDMHFVTRPKLFDTIELMQKNFNAEFLTITSRDNGLELLFRLESDYLDYYLNGDKQ